MMIMFDVVKFSYDVLKVCVLFVDRLGDKVYFSWIWKNYGGILEIMGCFDEVVEVVV